MICSRLSIKAKAIFRFILSVVPVLIFVAFIGCGGGGGGGDDGDDGGTRYTLTILTSGQGSVVTAPTGGVFDAGTVVALTAVPATGWQFAGWSGALSGTAATQQLTMNGNKTVTAAFTAGGTNSCSLTVLTNGQGTVVTVPPGTVFDTGTVVTLVASPSPGWEFSAWSGNLSGTAATQQLTMDADKTVTAIFVEIMAQDNEAPTWPSGTSAGSEDIGATFLTLTWGEAEDNVGVTIYRIFRDQVLTDTVEGSRTSCAITGLSLDTEYTFRVEAGDAAGNWTATGLTHIATTAAALPPDPSGIAPELDTADATSMRDATAFLYTGDDAVQKGVVPGTLENHRVAVIRGQVKDDNGQPISGVTVSILGMPELGRTTTRVDGAYDIAVNGGDQVNVYFEKEDFLPVKRQIKVPWQNYVRIDDVVMIERDINFTSITLNSATDAQLAEDTPENDADGTRQARLVSPKGVSGELVLADGTRQPLNTMNLRITEYTVGADGPKRMPAEMPPNIAYTYAMDLSIDEAVAADADDVVFDKPLYFYLDNFLGFPSGIKVPTGYYDDDRGVWVPSESGLVIKILSVNGDTVTVDTDGDDVAEDASTLAGLGFTGEELTKLAGLYAGGDTLWRVPVDHFSSWDCNFGAWPPEDADIPWFKPDKKNRPDPCKQAGSIVDTANMALGENIPLVGVPFKLSYRSSRMRGFTHTREIKIWDESVADSLQRILVELEVAGQEHAFEFEKDIFDSFPESFSFTWNGRDVYGRQVQGSVPMIVRVGYVYDGEYEANEQWGETIPDDVTATEIEVDTRQQIGLWNEWTVDIGGLDPRGLGLGGWDPDIHHAYDPSSRTLFRGDGEQRSADELDPVIITVAGTGQAPQVIYLWDDDGKPAKDVNLGLVNDIVAGPDGSLYIADPYRGVLRVTPDGFINRITGDLFGDGDGEGIEAAQAAVTPLALAVGPDESIFISENDRIRKITPDGLINTIAGDGGAVYGSEGGPAMGAAFEAWKIAVAPDGNLYILDSDACVIRKIGTDGRLTLFAGIPNDDANYQEAYTGEGGRAKSATFYLPASMTLGSDGSLYVGDLGANRVLRISPNGIITTVAGNGLPTNEGDGGPAVDATLRVPRSLAMGSDNTLYIGCDGAIRKVAPDGKISTFGGGDTATENNAGVPATQAVLGGIMGLDVGPDGNLYFFEGNLYIKKIATAFGDFSGSGEISIPDRDTNRLYVFNEAGRHLRTLDIWSGAVLWEFDYDAGGHLWKIRDIDGDETVIEHDLDGNPAAIHPPQGESTSLSVEGDGYLAQVIDPGGNTYHFVYDGTGGLLTDMTTPNGDAHAFEYYADGTLKKDGNPAGGSQTLVRETLPDIDGYRVSVTTQMGRVTTYETAYPDEGGARIVKTYPHGRSKTLLWKPDAGRTVQYVDGTEITLEQGPDPRFGMQMPIPKRLTEATPGGTTRETCMTREIQLGTIHDTILINDRSYTIVYDEPSRTFTLSTPEGREKVMVLNEEGRIETLQTNAMAAITLTYDSRGRTETVGIGSRSYEMAYDPDSGFLTSITDPLSGKTDFVRNAAGRIITKRLPDGRELTFDYDANGNVTAVTPPGKPVHILGYTEMDKLDSYVDPGAAATTFAYNDDGQIGSIDRPGSDDITFTYDNAGRVSSYTHPHDVVTAVYDGTSAMLTGLNTLQGINLSLGWDGFLLTDLAWSGPFSVTLQGIYNDDFRVDEIRIDGNTLASFSYDGDGLLTGAGSLALTRDINGMVTHTSAGQVTTDKVYNAYGDPESFTAGASGTRLMAVAYGYDTGGRITDITETIDDVTSAYHYSYDSAGRLMNVTKDGNPMAAYTYDTNSNRTGYAGDPGDAVATYDDRDRMLTYGDAVYTYSAAGALQTKTVGGDTTTAYVYDAVGNLRNVTLPDGSEIQYLIDGMNRRIGRKVDGELTQGFIYLNQLSPVAEIGAAGAVISRFVYGSRSNVPQLMIKGGITYRIISDHLGSPRLVVNTSDGSVVQRLDYDTFGRVVSDSSPGFQPFGFAGGLYDSDTGLVRFGARDYDPGTGRWTNLDPMLFGGGNTNLYGYVLADPVNLIDPTGCVFLSPAQFRQLVGTGTLDVLPSSQTAADVSGAIGDAALETVTAGLAGNVGKDLREAAGVDIVNECSETYKKTKKGADIVFKTATAVQGIGSLRSTLAGLNQAGGAAEFFSSFENAWGLGSDVAGNIQTFAGD